MSNNAKLQTILQGRILITQTGVPVNNAQVELVIADVDETQYGILGVGPTDSSGYFFFYVTDPAFVPLLLGNSIPAVVNCYVNGLLVNSLSITYNGQPINIGIDETAYNDAVAATTGTASHYRLLGEVLVNETGEGINNVLVNVTDSAGVHGLIAKGFTSNNSGSFSFVVFDNVDTTLITNGTIVPLYNIVVNGQTISSQTYPTDGLIKIAQSVYTAALAIPPVQRNIIGSLVITETGLPLTNTRIDVLLPNYGLIGSTVPDVAGNFILSVISDPLLNLSTVHPFFLVYVNNVLFNTFTPSSSMMAPVNLNVAESAYKTFIAAAPVAPAKSELSIAGKVLFAQTGLPVTAVEVDIVDQTNGYGKIASTNVDQSGNFSFTITDPVLANMIGAQLIIPSYKVYSNGTSLISLDIPYTTSTVQVSIDQSTYDAAIPTSQVTTIQIGGVLKTGGIVAHGITVNIYESSFRSKVLLNSTVTDINGNYKATINVRDLNNVATVGTPGIRIEAVDSSNNVIATSGDIFQIQDGLQVNLSADSASAAPTPEFTNLLHAVQNIVGPTDIGSLTVDPSTMTDELTYVNNAIGRSGSSVDDIVKAHKYGTDTSLSPSYLYALVKVSDGNRNPLLSMTESQIRSAISGAVINNVISSAGETEVNTFITAAKAYQVTTAKQLPIVGETHTLNDVLRSFIPADADVDNFLSIYNAQEYASTADLWTAYTTAYGATMAHTAQTGLQLAGITGFQPQVMSSLVATIGTGSVSQLASWSESNWLSVINTVSTSSSTLCVPASIRGTSTDPANATAKTQYAQQLASIVKNMYPLTSISADLQGSNGHLIVGDSTTRSQAVTFITNNPSFDLRQNSIHDIVSDSTTLNLTGVTNASSIQSALAPMQRMLRLTGGTPDAVSQMISSGVDSALAITQMGKSAFVSEFSGILGGDDAAGIVYANAVYASQYASHSLVDAIQAARNSVGTLPGFSNSSVAARDGSSSTIEPDLSTLFGSLDYCNCEQCMSMYSPTAYLADILNFIKNASSSAYTELNSRRPDIFNTDLSCKNANTSMPYIDLVNELLEMMVLKSMGVTPPVAFQTSGTQAEIAAYPEHVFKSSGVYTDFGGYASLYSPSGSNTTLANAIYPGNLPFSLALEEARSYLQYLGNTRYELMELFQPFLTSAITSTGEITGYSTFCEWLGIPQASADIITKSVVSTTPWAFYGFSSSTVSGVQDPENTTISLSGQWDTLLCGRLDVLLKQANITYNELLQFLGTNFMNPGGNITISAVTGANGDTCALNELHLVFAGGATADAFLDKLYRFVRLYRSGKLTIDQWDILLRSFNIGPLDSAPLISGVTATWSQLSTSTSPPPLSSQYSSAVTGSGASTVVAGSMTPGSGISSAGAFNSNGYNCQVPSGVNWPTAITTGYQLDYPIAPVTGNNLVINSINLKTKISGSYASMSFAFAYSMDGGAFTSFGSPQTANYNPADGGTITYITLNGINLTCNSGHSMVIRMYLYTNAVAPVYTNNSRHAYISNVYFTGSTTTVALTYATGPKNGNNMTDFEILGRGVRMADELSIAPELLAAWWSDIDIHNYLDYNSDNWDTLPSLYQKVFSSRSVINDPTSVAATIFANPATLGAHTYSGNTALIASFCRMAESDVIALLNLLAGSGWATTSISLTMLSRIYVLGQLSKLSGFSITDMIIIIGLLNLNINPPYPSTGTTNYSNFLDNLDALTDSFDAIKASGFTVTEFNYLVNNIDDQGSLDPAPLAIQLFYEALQTDLKKYPTYTTGGSSDLLGKLTNVVYQHFSSEFGVTSQWIQDMLDPGTAATFTSGLVLSSFMTATASGLGIETNFESLYVTYRKIYKSAFIAKRLMLTTADFEFFYSNGAVIGLPFASIPVTGNMTLSTGVTTQSLFQGVLCLCNWIQVRNALSLPDTGLSTLLHTFALTTPSKSDWLNFFEANTSWTPALLIALVGVSSEVTANSTQTDNLLRTSFPANFAPNVYDNINLIYTINEISNICNNTGLSVSSLHTVLTAGLSLDDSHKILFAAKGTKDDNEWAKIAKPLRDVIRKKQRDALVSFVLAHPPSGNLYRWQNEDDLYAYLLIDTQMEPVMLTSRIKQATSTAQLFIDRVLMNLEYSGGNLSAQVGMSVEAAQEWKEWRKWYRIWEPNRQVFLYPENFMEPELRDDKTPFFKDLEDLLQQEEVTKDNVEEAMRQYLYALEDVAHLEPVGSCNDTDPITGQQITHVFARTHSDPHKYYFRSLEGNVWTPWKKIDVDISSDSVIPYVWNGKLYLFWLTFADKMAPIKNIPSSTRNDWFYNNLTEPIYEATTVDLNVQYYKQIEVTINWTEHKNGSWIKHQAGSDKLLIKLNPSVLDKLTAKFADTKSDEYAYYEFLTKGRKMSVTDIVKSRIYILPLTLGVNNEDVLLTLLHPNDMDDIKDESASALHGFIFEAGRKEPHVWEYYTTYNNVAPTGTIFRNFHYVSKPGSTQPLYQDSIETVSDANWYIYPSEWNYTYNQKSRGTQQTLLGQNPYGAFYVTGNTLDNWQTASLSDPFIYADKGSVFFVKQNPRPTRFAIAKTSVNIGAVSTLAASHYPVLINAAGGNAEPQAATSMISERLVVNHNALGSQVQTTGVTVSNTTFTQNIGTSPTYYTFQAFYHPKVQDMLAALDSGGADNLLQLSNQSQDSSFSFAGSYVPNGALLDPAYPQEIIDFSATGAYSQYNWEVFFHIPMLIATRLSSNQQFEDAQKWFHYIFDPTSNVDGITGAASSSIKRFWKFWPFYNQSTQPAQTLGDLVTQINDNNTDALAQITAWEENPFDPFAIARIRTLAFMKNVVMKYIDNLIAWGDYLFTQDTIESINEATQLYILAANILGTKPVAVNRGASEASDTFLEMNAAGLDDFSNALVAVENYANPVTGNTQYNSAFPPGVTTLYFCLPDNDQLLGYWDTVADRLFKIRNSLNIAGQFQQLPLFDTPINPALLVRAAAAGVDISSVVNDQSSANIPNYRFTYMLQKANELCGDVKGLGSALLSALEKKDAEAMALLRSGLELNVLNSMLQMKQKQLAEATANLDALNASKDVTVGKLTYYSTRVYTNAGESAQLSGLTKALNLQTTQAKIQALTSALSILPQFHGQAIGGIGASFGGQQISAALQFASTELGVVAGLKSSSANISGISGGFDRRRDEWNFQIANANLELIQIGKQIAAAEIRVAIAQNDVDNQQLQIANNRTLDDFMRTKYTNVDLYNWMVTQISTTYFQAYQLAFAYAKKAAACYDHELPFVTTDQSSGNFIGFGYWDSLKKGLQAGEKLQYDLRKLEAAYIDNNVREMEMTKHISLAMLAPEQMLQLRETGTCDFSLPGWLFDLDYPGQYMRRIKSVSLSIPCVAGPYTTIASQLTLNSYKIETLNSSSVKVLPTNVTTVSATISSSSAQNDSGLFEVNFRDERYLPFEGFGAISNWTLKLANTLSLKQFDYETISDIILHMKYTAQYNSTADAATQSSLMTQVVNSAATVSQQRYFSLKHDFANQWFTYANAFAAAPATKLNIALSQDQFPFFCQGKNIHVSNIYLQSDLKSSTSNTYVLTATDSLSSVTGNLTGETGGYLSHTGAYPLGPVTATSALSIHLGFANGSASVNIDTLLDDLYLVVEYTLS